MVLKLRTWVAKNNIKHTKIKKLMIIVIKHTVLNTHYNLDSMEIVIQSNKNLHGKKNNNLYTLIN
jgi:hypothetical protein